MDKITIEVDNLAKVSDGYHTIEELYEHRCLLFIAYCVLAVEKDSPKFCAYIKEHLPGWFLLVIDTGAGQMSYHCNNKFLHLVEKSLIPEDSGEHKYDGHTSKDVLDRLTKVIEDKGIKYE